MAKKIRYKYFVAQRRGGSSLSKSSDYSLTEEDILRYGYSFIVLSTNATLTLPAASAALKGVSIYVHVTDRGNVFVSGGFGGGGASYDTVVLYHYDTCDFWCDGSYWYAVSVSVTGATSSSSSSCRSSSSSSSSCRSSSSSCRSSSSSSISSSSSSISSSSSSSSSSCRSSSSSSSSSSCRSSSSSSSSCRSSSSSSSSLSSSSSSRSSSSSSSSCRSSSSSSSTK